MILTCPSCQTKYVVKDGAIPPGGRQVRCASCKESWRQMPEGEPPAVLGAERAPALHEPVPPPDDEPGMSRESTVSQSFSDDVMASDAAGIAAEPVPDMEQREPPSEEPDEAIARHEIGGGPPEPVIEPAAIEEAVIEPVAGDAPDGDEVRTASEDDFSIHIPDDEDAPRGRGKWLLIVAVLLALAAAAAWFFAPDSLKSRIGIASSDKSPLELMVTTSDRQQLASGNELLAISGRVINPTAEEQSVPPIRAELRNKVSKKLVYQWTIAPPARSLPPGGSATFNSAEVDIPPGGDELTVTLANAAG